MPVDDFGAIAARIAEQVRTGSHGFITMKKEEIREAFGVGRMTQGLAEQVVQALWDHGMFAYPNPAECANSLRVYDQAHPIGQAAFAVVAPDATTEAPLRALARIHQRAKAGEELRSDDVPWLDGFDILLQLTVGRQPEGWEDLKDDRHGSMLAQELALSLGLSPALIEARWFINLAAAVNRGRPRDSTPQAGELTGSPTAVSKAEELAKLLARRESELRTTHRETLVAAARTVLQADDIPEKQIELGILGMRRRIEDKE